MISLPTSFSSRKFVIAVLIYIATLVGGIRGFLNGDQVYKLLLFIGGMYASANVLNNLVNKIAGERK